MKKILVLSFYFEPDLCAGSFRCTALVKALLEQGASVHVVTTQPNRYSSFKTNVNLNNQFDALKVDRISVPGHNSGKIDQIMAFYAYFREAKKIVSRRDYDIVFATSSRLFTAFLGARVSKSKKIPLYLDIRDLFADTIKEVLSTKLSFLISPILFLIEKYTFNSASKLNIVSEGFKPYFRERYPDIPISNYCNGIDDEFINKKRYVLKKSPNKDVINVVYAGNIGEGQGLHKIIPDLAVTLDKKIKFKIIGDGGLLYKLRHEINKREIVNVELLPPMKRDALVEEYQKADVLFLHLNDFEAFRKVLPSKLFEYGAMKKPIWAGVKGFSERFIKSELPDSVVFCPTDVSDAVLKFYDISFNDVKRDNFIKKFNRKSIMTRMAEDINGIK